MNRCMENSGVTTSKLSKGYYWIQLPPDREGDSEERPPIVAKLCGNGWMLAGNDKVRSASDPGIQVLSDRLGVNDGQFKTAFEQASKSVDRAHELLDAVREIVTDYNAAQVDDDSEVFESLEAIEMISELLL